MKQLLIRLIIDLWYVWDDKEFLYVYTSLHTSLHTKKTLNSNKL